MEIVKELNKDDGLEFIKNGSITHAVNVIVSKDGNSIQNEQSLETIVTLDENERIVGIIPCAKELVIFTASSKIYRYNEDNKELSLIEASWKWYGGEVFGTYTYNVRGDLIIAISERNPREDVPLKVINLNNANLGSDNIFTLNPDIPQTTVVDYGQEYGGRMRNGTYLLFIRFEISDNEFSSWKDLGVVIYLSPSLTSNIISSVTLQGPSNTTSTYDIRDYAREDIEYNANSIFATLNIDNKSGNTFKSFQIAYICTYKDGKEAFNLGSYSFNESGTYRISGNRSSKESISVDEVLISANNFNLYNVKTMCNYNNRLYVANYKEETHKLDISNIDTSSIAVGVCMEEDYYGNRLNDGYVLNVGKPIEDEVYRFYIHYVRPDGSYTEGIVIENNNYRHKKDDGTWEKIPVQIVIGRYYNTSTNKDVDIMFDCYDDTKVSDVKAAIEQAKIDYPGYYSSTIKDKLGLIDMAEKAKIDYYWFNLDPRFTNGNTTHANPYWNMIFCCPYTNNNGDRLFRTPHKIKGNFTFREVPMYEGFVGFFISYEEIQSILICDGIVDQHRDIAIGTDTNSKLQSSFNSVTPYGYSYQFYSDDIYVLKKSATPNVFVDLGVFSFMNRDAQSANEGWAAKYIAKDCFPGSNRIANIVNTDPYYNIENTYNIGVSASIISNTGGQYYKLTFPSVGKAITPVTVNVMDDGSARKLTTIGRLLYVSQEIYIKKEGVKLIRLGQTKYINGEITPTGKYMYGDNLQKQNVTGFVSLQSVIIFDSGGVKFVGDWCPRFGDDSLQDERFYRRYIDNLNPSANTRDNLHINAVEFYKQTPYLPSAKIMKNNVPEVYFTYTSSGVIKNIGNKQLTAATLFDLYEIASMYYDYARPNLNAYNPNAVSNQITTYGKFIRRSNVLQSESTANAWRQFPADGYKAISENKGDIINILGIGIYLIAHCEHSMFIFNRDSTLATKDKDVQMYMPDAFDTEYQEVFTSEKGYGGLQDYNAFTCNETGYIFFDKSKRRIYRFDDKQLNDITDGIQSIIDNYVTEDTIIDMGMDKENNRLICSFTGENQIITLSYSFITSSWISIHNYSGKYFNTKTELYLTNDNALNYVYRLGNIKVNTFLDYGNCTIPESKNIFYLGDKNVGCAVIDIIFNLEFETIKLLNYICYAIKNSSNINYSGDKILIFTNSCISSEWDISNEERNVPNLTKAYYEHGKWNFNYFRNLINTIELQEPINRLTGKYNFSIMDGEEDRITISKNYKASDSLINGKYIGIRFIIHETNSKVSLSNIECYVNKYRE